MAIQKQVTLKNHAEGEYWRIQSIQFDTVIYNLSVDFALFVSERARQESPFDFLDFMTLKFTMQDLEINDVENLYKLSLNELKEKIYIAIKNTYNEKEIDFSSGNDV